MGFGDLVDKGKDLAAENKEAVKGGIDKAADLADEKTGGKHSGHIGKGADAAKGAVEDLDDEA